MNKRIPLIWGGAVTAAALVIGGATMASGTADLKPSIHTADGDFWTSDQVDAAWTAATAGIRSALPEGVSYPKLAPAFFHPEAKEGESHLFQTGLPELIAARFWRCAWLDEELDAKEAGDHVASQSAETASRQYAELPGVAELVDVTAYEADVADFARTNGVDAAEAEFDTECEIYLQGGFVR